MTTIPTPTKQRVGVDPFTRKPVRARVFSWDLDLAALAADPSRLITHVANPGDKARVELRIGHSSNRKAFYATIGQRVDTADGATVYSPLDDVTISQTHVARYSEKALDAYAATVLASLVALVADKPKAALLLTQLVAPVGA